MPSPYLDRKRLNGFLGKESGMGEDRPARIMRSSYGSVKSRYEHGLSEHKKSADKSPHSKWSTGSRCYRQVFAPENETLFGDD